MKQKCIEAVNQAAGRSLTQAELQGIVDRVQNGLRGLAVKDRDAYLAMSEEQRLRAAAVVAADELKIQAIKKRQRLALTIQKHDQIENYVTSQKARGMNPFEALKRMLDFGYDGKGNIQSVATRAKAISRLAISEMLTTIEATQPKILGLFTNKEGIRALVYELFGQDSSAINPKLAKIAKQGAEQWSRTADNLRKQFNNNGGEIGKLEDWRMPQSHNQALVAMAAKSEEPSVNMDAWVNFIFGKIDRRRYVKESGELMNDAEMIDFLNNAWTTIATGGASKEKESVGSSSRARRHAESRAIHFKDADSYLEYQDKFGGRSAYDAMIGHVEVLARDIATLETFGPNPDAMFDYWTSRLIKEESTARPQDAKKITGKDAVSTEELYNYVTGKSLPIANETIAKGFDTVTNWMVATKLGTAFVSSIVDNATLRLTAAYNNMSHMQLTRNQLATLNMANKQEKRMAQRAGLALDTFIGEMNRWGADSLGANFSQKAANLTMTTSLLNASTEAKRRAFGVTMFGSIGSAVEGHASLRDLPDWDKKLLKSKGVTETDFSVWRKAQLEDWGNGNDSMLTPEAIFRIPDEALYDAVEPQIKKLEEKYNKKIKDIKKSPLITEEQKLKSVGEVTSLFESDKSGIASELKREAALKLLGNVLEEVDMAVVTPGARDRARLVSGLRRGKIRDEIMKSVWLFKGYPIALLRRHLTRGMNLPNKKSKAAYIAKFFVGTTLLGAVSEQIRQIILGNDPKDMTTLKFWIQAVLKGGSLGIYGDFVFNTNTQYGNTATATLMGPITGYAEDLIGLTQGTAVKMAQGKEVHPGAEGIRFLKNNIPLQNLWYTRAVTDRLIFNQLQELVSPGYNRRIESRARKEYGQEFWWPPGEPLPERGPDLERAVGQ